MTIQPGGMLYTQGFGSRPENVEVPHIDVRPPSSTDINFPIGKSWIDKIGLASYVLLAKSTSNGIVSSNWAPASGVDAYPITPYVVGPTGKAAYQTIQSAVNAANAAGGGMVWIQSGTYTENLTLYSGIQLSSPSEQSVTIIGTHTPPSSGTLNIDRMTLQSSTNIFSSTAAGTTSIIIEDCSVIVTNGYTFNIPNFTSSASVAAFNIGNFGTNDGFFNNTGGCQFYAFAAGIGNGSSNTLTVSGISVFANQIVVGCPVHLVTGASLNSYGSSYMGTFTTSNNSTFVSIGDDFSTGSSVAISHGSSGTATLTNSTINTSHNPAISGSGAGTLTLGMVTFTGTNSSIANTLTLAYAPTISGSLTLGGNLNLSSAGPSVLFGAGSPNGTITAAQGSLYLNTTGNSSSTRAFINSNSGTTWIAVTTAS